jgi:hypothetical protein
MFVVFYTVSLHILCICDLFHILLSCDNLMDQWNVCVCVDGHEEANSCSSQFCSHV